MFDNTASNNIIVTGSIKADIKVSDAIRKQASGYRKALEKGAKRLVMLAASTHKGEDEIVLAAYKKLKPLFSSLLLVLVPRHPERFDSVAELCRQAGLVVARKNKNDLVSDLTDILLADTMGELFILFGICDIAIMGGTFIEHGGHNPLEPAAWGLPIVSGQSDYNFLLATQELMRVGALSKANGADDLTAALRELMQTQQLRQVRGQAAIDYIEKNSGALDKVIDIVEPFIQKK
jgi:3-deoxy-D-manno-octulosonic-acid transferase